MRKPTLEESFTTLKVQNGDSFETARKAYKTQMHRLHPDRFPNDIEAQKSAAGKFAYLKHCFKLIEDHYKTYGEMPVIASKNSLNTNSSNTVQDAREENNYAVAKQRTRERNRRKAEFIRKSNHSNKTPSKTKSSKLGKKNASAFEIGAGLFIIGILAYLVLHGTKYTFGDKKEQRRAATEPQMLALEPTNRDSENLEAQNQSDISSADSNTAIIIEADDPLLHEQLKAKAILAKTQQRLHESESGKSFTFGSSFAEVAAIHGVPDKSEHQTWYYDESRVIFEDGKVVDWQSHPSYPLATRLKQ